MKPMLAALLAFASTVALANNANALAQSKGKYFIRTDAPVVLQQPAVLAPAATTILQQPAVLAPSCSSSCSTTLEQPAVLAPSDATILEQPAVLDQSLAFPAFTTFSAASLDPAALSLYRGPRLENTLTMPDASTYLRP